MTERHDNDLVRVLFFILEYETLKTDLFFLFYHAIYFYVFFVVFQMKFSHSVFQ